MGGEGSTGSSQCWSVAQPVHSSLLPPTMASVASDEYVFAQFKQQSRKQYVRMWLVVVEVAVAEDELDLSDFVMEEDAELCAAAGIPVSDSVDIQQRIESALSSVPGLQVSNVTVKVCVISNNHGTVNF